MVTAAFVGLPIFISIWLVGVYDVFVRGYTLG